MFLNDKDIRTRIFTEKLIENDYSEDQLNSVSYDLTIGKIISDTKAENSYILAPSEVIFIKTKEKLNMPYDLMGIVSEKNSRMRQGLRVDAPKYFPGHSTYMFLRIENLSNNSIQLKRGMKIAQIMFCTLSGQPETTYDNQPNASFNNEDVYKGLGKYQDEYRNQISSIDDKQPR